MLSRGGDVAGASGLSKAAWGGPASFSLSCQQNPARMVRHVRIFPPPRLTRCVGIPFGVPGQEDEHLVAALPRQPIPAVRRAVLEIEALAHVVRVDLVAFQQVRITHRLPVAKRQRCVFDDGDEGTPDAAGRKLS